MNQPTCSWFPMPPIPEDCIDASQFRISSHSPTVNSSYISSHSATIDSSFIPHSATRNSGFIVDNGIEPSMESSNFGEFYQQVNVESYAPQFDSMENFGLSKSSTSIENWSEFPSTSCDAILPSIPVETIGALEQQNSLTPMHSGPVTCLATNEALHTPVYADMNGRICKVILSLLPETSFAQKLLDCIAELSPP